MPRYTLKSLLIAITLIGAWIGLLRGCYVALTHYETEENVDHVSWLPGSASNVSYYRSYSYTAYEFDMSEDEFKKWIRFDVKPITKPVDVYRYSHTTANRPDLGPNPTIAQLEAWEAIGKATIKNGHYHSHRRGNGGGVDVAFDRDRGRVFFQTNPR
jgi:hypothetical protein